MDKHLLTADRDELLRVIEQQEQNIHCLQELVAKLSGELTLLRGEPTHTDGESNGAEVSAGSAPAFVKPNRQKRTKDQPRKKRARGYARRRQQPTQRVVHALDSCPRCGSAMRGGSVKRTRQVLNVPIAPVEVVEHVFVERCCPLCHRRSAPSPDAVLKDVIGQHRVSVSTMAMVAAMHEVGRLPINAICWFLKAFHGLALSVGEVVDILHTVARQGEESAAKLAEELRASPVVHGDETTWREDGRNGYFWAFTTPSIRYFLHRFSRSGGIVNEVLGKDFDGTLVSDFYSGYNRMEGQHQRCWAHLLRDIHELKEKWPTAADVSAWADQVHAIYKQAQGYCASHPLAPPKERAAKQHALERELLALAEPYLETDCPQHVLCKRISSFLPELFTFVADPRVPSDNNAAERSIRPLAVSRKISGGTRSDKGTQTKGVLATIFGTWTVRHLNPFTACCQLLAPP